MSKTQEIMKLVDKYGAARFSEGWASHSGDGDDYNTYGKEANAIFRALRQLVSEVERQTERSAEG